MAVILSRSGSILVFMLYMCCVHSAEHKDKLHATLDTFEKIDSRIRGVCMYVCVYACVHV